MLKVGSYFYRIRLSFKPNELYSVAYAFYRIGVDKQIESVLDSLWEISNKSIPFSLLGPLRIDVQHLMAKNGKLNDWRIFSEKINCF